MGTESSCEAKLETSHVPLRIFIIFAPWEYKSKFGMGADHGQNICVYSPARRAAIYIQTRDLVAHYEMRSITGRLRQQNEINARRDIFSRVLIEAKANLEEQINYLRATRAAEFTNCWAVVAQLPIGALDTLLDINSSPQVVYNLLQERLQSPSAEAETL